MSSRIILALLVSSLLIQCSMSADCSPGTYSTDGQNTNGCTDCPIGTTSLAAARVCTNCPSGSTTSAVATPYGPTACIGCNAGQYVTGLTDGTTQSCSDCPPGSACPAGTAIAANSPVAGVASATTSTPCPRGTTSAARASVCTNCPQGSTTANTGTLTSAGCTGCQGGQYVARLTTGAAQTCSPCAANTYCPRGSAVSASGLIAAATTPTSLSQCLAGTSSSESSSSSGACTPCGAGTYGTTDGSGCTACPKGSYCAGGTAIVACPTGQTTASTGKSAATDCVTSSSANVLVTSTFLLVGGVLAL